jgi:hypothetical protein
MKNYLIFSVVFLVGACMNNKVEFKPIEKKNDLLVISERNVDSTFANNLEQVLKYYGEKYERSDKTVILIEESLYADKDLMYNYTNKAKDAEWLETHKK